MPGVLLPVPPFVSVEDPAGEPSGAVEEAVGELVTDDSAAAGLGPSSSVRAVPTDRPPAVRRAIAAATPTTMAVRLPRDIEAGSTLTVRGAGVSACAPAGTTSSEADACAGTTATDAAAAAFAAVWAMSAAPVAVVVAGSLLTATGIRSIDDANSLTRGVAEPPPVSRIVETAPSSMSASCRASITRAIELARGARSRSSSSDRTSLASVRIPGRSMETTVSVSEDNASRAAAQRTRSSARPSIVAASNGSIASVAPTDSST